MRKVLIITYYWPPSGGGGVQRWLKFVKHLPSNGWKPVVVVPENPEYPVIDPSLESDIPPEAEIIRLPIWEPYGIFKKITGRKKEEKVNNGLLFDEKKQTFLETVSLWIRGNFLIPDPRVFWVKPSSKRLIQLLPEINPEIVITTGTPHSVHLIGYHLKKKTGIPWIADLRDPWSTLDLLDKFYPTKLARNRQKHLEKKVLSEANQVITVSSFWAKELQDILNKPVGFITNGYDNGDICPPVKSPSTHFIISHIGMINSFRNQNIFWEALDELCSESEDFNQKLIIQIVGTYDKRIYRELARYRTLASKLTFSGYIDHCEVKHKYANSGCLLVLQNRTKNAKGHIPGKVFEYLASGKPILALADPNSDLGRIISDCQAGKTCNFDDKESIKNSVMSIFNQKIPSPDMQKIEAYSRKNLTKDLTEVIDKTIAHSSYRLKINPATDKKKVLIITYYWPPSGGGGVMRWLKMSKYLPEFGWQPIIYTPSNPDSSVYDYSLVDEVHKEIIEIKTPIWEPYHIYRKMTGKKENATFKAGYISEASGGNWKNKLSVFIRGNFLIPDPRRFWIKPSVKFLNRFLSENSIDLIVSTGPPHSMHLIALGLKKKLNIPWIADFRDPWTDIDFYSKLRLTQWADKKHRRLESEVIKNADHVVTVSPSWQKDFEKKHNRKVELVNNGYDPEDFNFEAEAVFNDTFCISHFGAFNKDRNPSSLWVVLKELAHENPEFKKALRIQLIGQTDESITNEINQNGLMENLILSHYLPHREGIGLLRKSQVLLLPINDAPNLKGILPGKMYEYLALKRPILAVGPTDADYAKIICETNAGVSHNFDDIEGIKTSVRNFFSLFQQNKLLMESGSYEKYSRKNLTEKFIHLLKH